MRSGYLNSNTSAGAARVLGLIVLAGVIAGSIDLAYAFAFYGARGIAPTVILQSIASGWMGTAAFQSGTTGALVGAAFHYAILIAAAALYFAASRKLIWLSRRALICGLAYGLAIYLMMHYVVLPLSAAPKFKTDPLSVESDIAVHILLLGPAIALTVTRHVRARRRL